MPRNNPSRRTTLGGLDANRRKSPALERSRKTYVSKHRVSMIPRMAGSDAVASENDVSVQRSYTPSRRKSHGSELRRSVAPSAATRADPRKVFEKSFIYATVNTLMEFLTSNGYEHPVSRKTLLQPSGRDFNQVVTFLMRRISPNFNDGSQKFEDEVSMAFKTLGYPFPISKTALFAVGSPNSWPPLLAALGWLVELLICDACDEENNPSSIDESQMISLEEIEARGEKFFSRYLNDAYVAFLSADDCKQEALSEALFEYFEKDKLKLESEIQRKTELNLAVEEEINKLLRSGDELPKLKQRREGYATDLEKFYDLVKKLEEHKATLTAKVQERTAEMKKMEEEFQNTSARVESLKRQIETQEFSVEDVRKMQKEKKRIEESIARATGTKSDHDQDLTRTSLELSQRIEQLQEIVARYNQQVKELSPTEFLELRIDMAGDDDPSKLFSGKNIKREVLPLLTGIVSDHAKKCARHKSNIVEIQTQKEANEGALALAMDDIRSYEREANKLQDLLSSEQTEQEKKISSRLKEIDIIETKITALRDPVALEAAIAKCQTQCNQLEELRQKHQKDNVLKKKAMQEEINFALRHVAQQKEHIRTQLQELGNYIQDKKSI